MTARSRWQWLDFDLAESDQVRDFLSQDIDGDGVDPLRIGASVRDRMAEALFPGTSTQYTRLRYVILVAAILRKKGTTLDGLAHGQSAFNIALARANPGENGVIGRRTPSRDFVRLYWTALRTWGFLTSVNADIRDINLQNGLAAMQPKGATDEEGRPLLDERVQWNATLVQLADHFWSVQRSPGWPSILCTSDEAEFIVAQWTALPPASALAAIARRLQKGRQVSNAAYPWDVPLSVSSEAFAALQRAKAVSLICWSAQLAYNFALLEKAKSLDDTEIETVWKLKGQDLASTEKTIRDQYARWRTAFKAEHATLGPWADPSHWDPLGSDVSRVFLAKTAEMLAKGETKLTAPRWAAFVTARERINPAPKLSHPGNLATWTGTPDMASRWDFRWRASVRRLIQDAESPHG